jgi:hypothetical protein
MDLQLYDTICHNTTCHDISTNGRKTCVQLLIHILKVHDEIFWSSMQSFAI